MWFLFFRVVILSCCYVFIFLFLATSIMFNVYWANLFRSDIPQLDHPVTEFCKRKWFSKLGFRVFSVFGDKCGILFPNPLCLSGKGCILPKYLAL